MPISGTIDLVSFEAERNRQKFIPYNSDISDVGESKVEMITIRRLPGNPRFDLNVKSKHLRVGPGDFSIVGDQVDPNHVYRYMTICPLAKLSVTHQLIVTGSVKQDITSRAGRLYVEGQLTIGNGAALVIHNHGTVLVDSNGTLIIDSGASINFMTDGKLIINGTILMPAELIGVITMSPNVTIGPMATVKIAEVPGARAYSLTDYLSELNKSYQPVGAHSTRSMSAGTAVAGFECIAGNTTQTAHVLKLLIKSGKVVLGDWRLRVYGMPAIIDEHYRIVSDLIIEKDAELIISTDFMGYNYHAPTLFVGRMFSEDVPAKIVIDGTMRVNVSGTSINLFSEGSIIINEGSRMILENNAIIAQDATSHIIINGDLIIDNISQLEYSVPENYSFGEHGRLIVLNPSPHDDWKRTTVFSIPEGIKYHLLTKLFGDRLDKVQFHISKNCGIEIDTDMSPMHMWDNWYNGVRLARAIANGWLVWHAGAYIAVDRAVLPWLTVKQGLGQVSKLFNSTKATERERLQELANRLKYAGAGDVVFRFTDLANGLVSDTTLSLGGCNLISVSYDPTSDRYGIISDNSGELYLTSPPTGVEAEHILTEVAKVFAITEENRISFKLP